MQAGEQLVSEEALARQERLFAGAFAARDLELARPLYHPEVVYLSPTVRLFGWPERIVGVDRALQFIALTIESCRAIVYRPVESALLHGGMAAFVRVHFDFTVGALRLRSSYVVLYRYCDGLIAQQELYYDPSARPEELPPGDAPRA